jgi:hypothetical protein
MARNSALKTRGRRPAALSVAAAAAADAMPVLSRLPERAQGTLGGSAVVPREAGRGELGGHDAGPTAPPSEAMLTLKTRHPKPNPAMSEKTTKTIETANVPGHDKKVETHTEETRHQPETKVEKKTESTEQKPE